MINHILIRSKNIRQQKFISIPIHIQRFIYGHFQTCLIISSEIHENLILNASGSIGGQLDVLIRLKGIDGFDESDGSDGN